MARQQGLEVDKGERVLRCEEDLGQWVGLFSQLVVAGLEAIWRERRGGGALLFVEECQYGPTLLSVVR